MVLGNPLLVLNKNWMPIRATTVMHGLMLVWRGRAEIICPETYQSYGWDGWVSLPATDYNIKTARAPVRAPQVVRLVNYGRVHSGMVAFSRRNLMRRDHHSCQYCGAQPGRERITLDHVVPRAAGGQTDWLNCVAACFDCNNRKADRTPEQAGMRLRRAPYQPEWEQFYGDIPVWEKFGAPARV